MRVLGPPWAGTIDDLTAKKLGETHVTKGPKREDGFQNNNPGNKKNNVGRQLGEVVLFCRTLKTNFAQTCVVTSQNPILKTSHVGRQVNEI